MEIRNSSASTGAAAIRTIRPIFAPKEVIAAAISKSMAGLKFLATIITFAVESFAAVWIWSVNCAAKSKSKLAAAILNSFSIASTCAGSNSISMAKIVRSPIKICSKSIIFTENGDKAEKIPAAIPLRSTPLKSNKPVNEALGRFCVCPLTHRVYRYLSHL